MKISIIAFGSRGDVTPLVALGYQLKTEGHAVRLASHAEFAPAATAHGLEFVAVGASYHEFLATREGRQALGIPKNSPLGCLGLLGPFRHNAVQVFENCWHASDDADVVVVSALAAAVGTHIATRRNLPVAFALVVPSVPTRNFAHPSMPPWPLGRLYKRASYNLATKLITTGGRSVFAAWRRTAERLGGASRYRLRAVALVPVSPALLPRPTDWPSHVHITGFWFLPSVETAPTPELQAFINAGGPPLAIGFGSMPEDQPEELRAIVGAALEKLDTRAVVVGGAGAATAGFVGSQRLLSIPFANYDWLFGRASAIVHQGGIGTAAFALRAGAPQVVVPYCLDHAFWASHLRNIGVAPPPIRRHQLNVAALTTAIRQVLHQPSFSEAARRVREAVRAEPSGVEVAARLLIDHVEGSRQ